MLSSASAVSMLTNADVCMLTYALLRFRKLIFLFLCASFHEFTCVCVSVGLGVRVCGGGFRYVCVVCCVCVCMCVCVCVCV